jgi:hypothetical protein
LSQAGLKRFTVAELAATVKRARAVIAPNVRNQAEAAARDFAVAFELVTQLLTWLSLFTGPPSAAAEPAGKTRRATHMDVRRFLPRQEVASENPAGGVNP